MSLRGSPTLATDQGSGSSWCTERLLFLCSPTASGLLPQGEAQGGWSARTCAPNCTETGQARPQLRKPGGLPTPLTRLSLALGPPHTSTPTCPPQLTSLDFHLTSVTKGLSPPPRVSLPITSFMRSGCHQEPTPALVAHTAADGQLILERLVSQLRAACFGVKTRSPRPAAGLALPGHPFCWTLRTHRSFSARLSLAARSHWLQE